MDVRKWLAWRAQSQRGCRRGSGRAQDVSRPAQPCVLFLLAHSHTHQHTRTSQVSHLQIRGSTPTRFSWKAAGCAHALGQGSEAWRHSGGNCGMAGVKGVAEFFASHGSAITAALGISSVIAVGSWSLSSMRKDIELNKKDIEMHAMRHQKDIETTALRLERDRARELLSLTYTEEMKSFRDALAAKSLMVLAIRAGAAVPATVLQQSLLCADSI
mmetsp:Transcript_34877/g.84853  ORF Transcript_34877/g.84853 Transcript_34877/m.84853 type:complete len:215 (+) Transcript_34877:549-1193(+)